MLTCKALLLWEFPEAFKHQLLPEKTVNLGGWALLSGTYPCAWVSMYHQDSCLWRYDLIEPQQVNGITADYLTNSPDAPTGSSSSSPLVLEMSCFDCLGSFIIPWYFSWKTSGCNLTASLSCSTSTAAVWKGGWRWFGEAEERQGRRAGPHSGSDGRATASSASSSPTSQGQHSPCHLSGFSPCCGKITVIISKEKKKLKLQWINQKQNQNFFQRQIPTLMLCSFQFFCFSGFESLH